nr:immunoglobulin heavy chain junction region [Mus musculus]
CARFGYYYYAMDYW